MRQKGQSISLSAHRTVNKRHIKHLSFICRFCQGKVRFSGLAKAYTVIIEKREDFMRYRLFLYKLNGAFNEDDYVVVRTNKCLRDNCFEDEYTEPFDGAKVKEFCKMRWGKTVRLFAMPK